MVSGPNVAESLLRSAADGSISRGFTCQKRQQMTVNSDGVGNDCTLIIVRYPFGKVWQAQQFTRDCTEAAHLTALQCP